MDNYKDLVTEVLNSGLFKPSRNGIIREVFGKQIAYDLSKGFPIVTGRKMFYKSVFGELAAFLEGPTNVSDFKKHDCNYWDIFADEDGALRLAYGNAWRDFQGKDQLAETIKNLKEDPYSRRHLISAWDASGLDELTLECCHYAYNWCVNTNGTLDMVWVQRSADVMLGLPSDILLAAALNMLVAQTVGLHPGKIILQLGSVHIYEEHFKAAEEYINRAIHRLPYSVLDPAATVFNFHPDMLQLRDYQHEAVLNFELKK